MLQPSGTSMQIKNGGGADGKLLQTASCRQIQLARLTVDHTEGPEGIAFRAEDRHTRIKADARFVGHKSIVRETRVQRGVLDDHDLGWGEDGVRAE
jgi:hypothetical protein